MSDADDLSADACPRARGALHLDVVLRLTGAVDHTSHAVCVDFAWCQERASAFRVRYGRASSSLLWRPPRRGRSTQRLVGIKDVRARPAQHTADAGASDRLCVCWCVLPLPCHVLDVSCVGSLPNRAGPTRRRIARRCAQSSSPPTPPGTRSCTVPRCFCCLLSCHSHDHRCVVSIRHPRPLRCARTAVAFLLPTRVFAPRRPFTDCAPFRCTVGVALVESGTSDTGRLPSLQRRSRSPIVPGRCALLVYAFFRHRSGLMPIGHAISVLVKLTLTLTLPRRSVQRRSMRRRSCAAALRARHSAGNQEHCASVSKTQPVTQNNDKCYAETTGEGSAVAGADLAYLPRLGGA